MDSIRTLMSIDFTNDWWILLLPAALMFIDILTGVLHAWITGHLKSYRMREGLGRKFGELMVLITFELLTVGLKVPKYILTAASVYIIFMELVSLTENLYKLGVPLPRFVINSLGVAADILENDDLSDEAKNKLKEAFANKKKEG